MTSSTTPTTKPGTRADSDLVPGARYARPPVGIVSTGWPRVKATCGNIGWRFDPWQDAVGRLILAKREGGKWAADLSILSIPRQVGKSYLLGCIIFALCLLNPKLRVIWTSHHTATTEEMYEAMKELAQHKRVAPHVVKCIALQGSRWRIVFRNGSRIDFGARSQGFGRGKAKVGVLVLDEFQHITTRALANLAPTTNTSDNPLILCAGTPPGPEVNGEAFTMRRRAVLEGLSDDTFYVEFSADRDADPDDRRQWSKANPSFPRRTQERAFLLLRKVLEPADFRREALGIWDADDIAAAIPFGVWSNLADRSPEPAPHVGKLVLGVDSTLERSRTSIVAAGGRADGPPLVELIENLPGVDWAFDRLVAMCAAHDVAAVVIDKRSPAERLIPALEKAKVPVFGLDAAGFAKSWGQFHDAVVESGQLAHLGQVELDDAVRKTGLRTLGDALVPDRKGAKDDITPLIGAQLALYGLNGGFGVAKNAGRGRVVALT
jgi:hypothetical protein